MRAKGFIVLVGVLLTGLAAAWPFRQGPRAPALLPTPLVDVPLRRSEPSLEALPPSRNSPAVDLAAGDLAAGDLTGSEDASYADRVGEQLGARTLSGPAPRSELDLVATTPYLPSGFGSLATADAPGRTGAGPAEGASQGRRWHPVRLKLQSPKALRRHRITDGDSLESLAQRYLGSAARSAEIYALNGDILTAPDLLPLGRIIRIPPREQ